jgi:RNA polymerase sigma-70 factor (ECF subfamily)
MNPEMFAIRSEEAARLRDAIQELPPQYRIVLVLRDMEGLTDEEVAEITGLRPGTVRVRLHRARLFVRKEIMKAWRPREKKPSKEVVLRTVPTAQPGPARCKAMFAELSDYLDEQLDDSLCEELERHLDGCGPCKVFLASLKATIDECRKLPSECSARPKTMRLRKELVQNYKRTVAAITARS